MDKGRNRSVIIDECISPKIGRYLEGMGMVVAYINDGRPDSEVRRLGHRMREAIILTKNIRDFSDYPNAIEVKRKERPKDVYRKLMRMAGRM